MMSLPRKYHPQHNCTTEQPACHYVRIAEARAGTVQLIGIVHGRAVVAPASVFPRETVAHAARPSSRTHAKWIIISGATRGKTTHHARGHALVADAVTVRVGLQRVVYSGAVVAGLQGNRLARHFSRVPKTSRQSGFTGILQPLTSPMWSLSKSRCSGLATCTQLSHLHNRRRQRPSTRDCGPATRAAILVVV